MPEGSPEVYDQIDSPEAAAQMIVDHPPESAEELLSMLDKSGYGLAPAGPMEEPMMEEMGDPMMGMEEEMEEEVEEAPEAESEEEHGGFRSKKDQLRNEPIGITILSVAGKAMKKGKKKGKNNPKEDEGGY